MSYRLRHIALSAVLFLGLHVQAADTIRFAGIDSITALTMDVNGYSFLSDPSGTLYKFDRQGKEITRVNSKVYGRIASIDCSNPFEIYVYHQEQNVLVFYDNMLNMRAFLSLNEHGFTNVQAVARSFDNGIWLFDANGYELKKIDKEGRVLLSSGPITAFQQIKFNPSKIVEEGQKVYVVDSAAGLLLFDLFGTYLSQVSISPLLDVALSQERLFALQKGQVLVWDSRLLTQEVTPLSTTPAAICLYNGQLFGIHRDFIARIL